MSGALDLDTEPAVPREYAKSRTTRAQILAAAEEEARERGLHNTSVARIAARANVAVGSLNYHFGSRAELMRAMMRKLMADLFRRLAAAEHETGGDFFARLRADQLAYAAYVRANPAHVRLTDEIKFLEPELYAQGVADWVAILSEKLREGIAEGSVRPMDDVEVMVQAHFHLGARHFLEQVLDVPDTDAVVDAYVTLVRDGLAAPAVRQ